MSDAAETFDGKDPNKDKTGFNDINEISGYVAALGDPRQWKIKLFRSKPTALADGTKCDGHLCNIDSPDELEEDHVREAFGGGDFYILGYKVGDGGKFKKRWNFHLGGAATLPITMRDARATNAAPSKNGDTPKDDGLGAISLKAHIDEAKADRLRVDERDRENRGLAAALAKAEAEAGMLKMRLAELEKQPFVAQQQRSAEMVAAENMQTKALAVLEAGTKAQTAAAEARAAAAYEQMKEIRDRAEHNTMNAAEPYKQMIQMISERHSQDTAAMNQQFQNMMAMQTQAHQQQMEIYRAELKAKEERNDRKSSMKEMTETIEQVQKIMEGLGGKEQSMADKLIEKVPPEAFTAVLAVLAQAVGGGALPAVPPPPSLPAAPVVPVAPPGPTPEQQRKVIELVSNMKTLLQQKNPPVDTATYLNMSLGKDSTKLLLQGPVEELIQFLQQADPVFGGPDGEQWIRSVFAELRKTFK